MSSVHRLDFEVYRKSANCIEDIIFRRREGLQTATQQFPRNGSLKVITYLVNLYFRNIQCFKSSHSRSWRKPETFVKLGNVEIKIIFDG